MQLLLVGVNYKSAGLTAREPLSFDASARQRILAQLSTCSQIQEIVLLSTCNRTEAYAIVTHPTEARAALVSALCAESGLQIRDLDDLAYTFYNKFAATHLFEVASGLDSMVIGENEILRQVKDSLEAAQEAGASGPVLNQLLRFAITAGKRVRTETGINEGCASIGALAARLLRESVGPDARVLVLGAGQMATVLLRNLNKTSLNLSIANRSADKARELAAEYPGGAEIVPPAQVAEMLNDIDAVVACTAAPEHLITREHLAQRCPLRPLLLIDLAVPRNIAPDTASLEAVTLYDVDSLEQVIQTSIELRTKHVEQAQTIIAEEATRFLEWFHSRELVPTIRSLYEMFEDIRQREVARGLQKYREQLGPEAEAMTEEIVERITKAVTQKILHYPVVQLKNAKPDEQRQFDQALSRLFSLDASDGIDRYVHLSPPTRTPAHYHS